VRRFQRGREATWELDFLRGQVRALRTELFRLKQIDAAAAERP